PRRSPCRSRHESCPPGDGRERLVRWLAESFWKLFESHYRAPPSQAPKSGGGVSGARTAPAIPLPPSANADMCPRASGEGRGGDAAHSMLKIAEARSLNQPQMRYSGDDCTATETDTDGS